MAVAQPPESLAGWLAYQERLHPQSIALGLERVREVAQRLQLLPTATVTLTVAGTNGKGSSTVLADLIYRAAGYHVGRYTSPHLLHYHERVAIGGEAASDAALCEAFSAIEAAREQVPLTYFEFGTLAALWLFRRERVEVQVLEVGLGGRLDAVNIVDADCALITSIGLDHTDWLGCDLAGIAREKAGIMRAGRPAVCGQADVPASLIEHARAIGAPLRLAGRDFSLGHAAAGGTWTWRSGDRLLRDLPAPGLHGEAQYRNAAGVLAAVDCLQPLRPVPEAALRAALPCLSLPGRYQRVGRTVLDVAHNKEAVQVLADNLRADGLAGRVLLVLGMLADKPVEAAAAILAPLVKRAWFGSLPGARGLSGGDLERRAVAGGLRGSDAGSIVQAYRLACAAAQPGDTVLVCGSFLTVAAITEVLTGASDE